MPRRKGQWCGYNRCQLRRRADDDFPTMTALTIRTTSAVQDLVMELPAYAEADR
jgi:hypothetical protein